MSLKPTLRRNGKHMVNVRLTFILDGEEVTKMVAFRLHEEKTHYGDEPDAEITKAEAEKAVRDYLYWDGMEPLNWASEKMGEDYEIAMDWARAQVARLYPELAKEA